MNAGLVGSAIAMFAVTNIDDILLLSLYFGQAKGRGVQELRIVVGQYVGFGGILAVSIVGAYGASLLSGDVVAYLGLVPLLLGVRAAVEVWRGRDRPAEDVDGAEPDGPTIHHVAAITFANGGDNIGVYLPCSPQSAPAASPSTQRCSSSGSPSGAPQDASSPPGPPSPAS